MEWEHKLGFCEQIIHKFIFWFFTISEDHYPV